jgi:hypothetical protein
MSATESTDRRHPRLDFDRYGPTYRESFQAITEHMHRQCPIAWTDRHDGYWVAAGNREVFELARCPYVSNDRDGDGVGPGLAETLEKLQTVCDEQRLAEPVTVRKNAAQI